MFGANRVELRARGANGSIDLAQARVGGFRVQLLTKASVSEVGPKHLALDDGTVVTTAPDRTGLPSGNKIQIDATGRVTISDAAELDAGYRLTVRTRRAGDDLCLSSGARLAARRPSELGDIDLRGVEGQVFDDGTVTFEGVVKSNGINGGPCP